MEIIIGLVIAQFILVIFGKEKEIKRCFTPTLICIGLVISDDNTVQLTPTLLILIITILFGIQFLASAVVKKESAI